MVAVTDLHATVDLKPTVTTTVAVDARLTAGNDITIGANHGRALPFRVTVDGGIVNDDTGLVDFVVVGLGATVTKVFTIANVGDANLVITSPIMPAGFTLVTAPDLTHDSARQFDDLRDWHRYGRCRTGEWGNLLHCR